MKKSDVYSFGVFLLELISGREVISLTFPGPEQHLVPWAHSLKEANNLAALIDSTLYHTFTEDAMKEFLDLIFQCVEPLGERRPTMNEVTNELDRILEKERGLTVAMVEGTTNVTLGSELFKRTVEGE